MKRFRPYFRHLRAVRGPIAIAIFFGLLYGAASGAGPSSSSSAPDAVICSARRLPLRCGASAPSRAE